VRGAILDVAIDVRQGSPSYGLSVAVELTADNWRQLLIPRGFAHWFCTLQDNTQLDYKRSGYYQPAAEGGLLWSDPALGIDWPVSAAEAVVSDKDAVLPRLVEFRSPFVFGVQDDLR
jgi:dTDP-4-dehydrorhamnose 3,5-epimerase